MDDASRTATPLGSGSTVTLPGLVCPRCRAALTVCPDELACHTCGQRYRFEEGFPDLIVGERFPDALSESELEYEEHHCCHTARWYWAPLFQRVLAAAPASTRVLALGCGVGTEVDVLRELGYDCVGVDNGNRVSRWKRRIEQHRLVLANGMHLPFADATFDIVFCGCVFPHIGVLGDTFETTPRYQEERTRLAVEIGRVLAPQGRMFAASPNRLFPLDIFHGRESGSVRPRWNPPTDPFLLSVGDYRQLFRAGGCAETRAYPVRNYWMFRNSQRSVKGRVMSMPVRALFWASSIRGAPFLHGSVITPWIVVGARKTPAGSP